MFTGTKHCFTFAASALLVCSNAAAQEQARVLSSIPVSQQVAVPQQICDDVQINAGARTNGTGAVIGAVIGGLAGNAMGRGSYYGRRGHYYGSTRGPNTVVGAIAGGLIGHAIEGANSQPSYETVRRCTDTTAYEYRVVGYDVTYEYAGQRYTARMAHDPGPWLPISVQPQSSYVASTNHAPQFVGPSGMYQPAPSHVVVTGGVQQAPYVVMDAYGYPPPGHWR